MHHFRVSRMHILHHIVFSLNKSSLRDMNTSIIRPSIFHVLLIFLLPSKITSLQSAEVEALLSWKNNLFSSSSSSILESWSVVNSQNLCNWTGIICNSGGTVSEIHLQNAGLAGELAHFNFTSFRNLMVLNLENNGFSGSIPCSIGSLSKLTFLDLSSNFLHDILPSEMGNLTQLKYLSLYANSFIGVIPYQISNLQKAWYMDLGGNLLETPDWSKFRSMPLLKHLSFSHNELDQDFPDFIMSCHNLSDLYLSSNMLNGPIPETLFTNLMHLEYLDLSRNAFQGKLPANLSKLSNLKDLRLHSNFFSGSIPDDIGLLTNLQLLSLQMNSLVGPIPSSIAQLRNLYVLYLDGNGFNSSILSEVSQCKNLKLLALQNNFFTGEIPPHIFKNWPEMVTLSLSNNSFTGTIPSEIGFLRNAQRIYLYKNQFSGPIPLEIGNLMNLVELDLSENHLSGPIPRTIGNLRNLNLLYLFSNNLTSMLPPEMGNLTSLVKLDLYGNPLNGDFPFFLSNFTHLEFLFISNTHISGRIPSGFLTNISSLAVVDLANNFLFGQLPTISSAGHKNLSFISLRGNQLTGQLSPDWGKCENITYLDFGDNKISGVIPPELGNLTLRYLRLDSNKFKGVIPGELGNIQGRNQGNNLETLILNGNQLQGPVPQTLVNCSFLQVLDIGNNIIIDSFPQWTETLQELYVLILRSNRFHGSIETSGRKSTFKKLKILDLADNGFTGNLPANYFEHLEAMVKLNEQFDLTHSSGNYYDQDASVNLVIKGRVFLLARKLKMFTTIDLSDNNFHGNIPSSIGKLVGMRFLNLSHNNISGQIPSSLADLKVLESLDISFNSLNGEIPFEMVRITSLALLNLSYNQLVGSIPHSGQFLTFENTSFLGNPALCGFPLTKMCKDEEKTEIQGEANNSSPFSSYEYWDAMLIGYGCGTVLGIAIGYYHIVKS